MKITSDIHNPTLVIACGVFQNSLEYLELGKRYPQLSLAFLPANLHLRPQNLARILSREIDSANKRNEKTLCIYGDCFPDLAGFCEQQGVIKFPGSLCYEILLGREQYQDIIAEIPGTYFLEKDLIMNFQDYCQVPLQLEDREMRGSFFVNYKRIVYVRQPSDPDLIAKVCELAEFLGLPLEIADADYSYLEKMLKQFELSGAF